MATFSMRPFRDLESDSASIRAFLSEISLHPNYVADYHAADFVWNAYRPTWNARLGIWSDATGAITAICWLEPGIEAALIIHPRHTGTGEEAELVRAMVEWAATESLTLPNPDAKPLGLIIRKGDLRTQSLVTDLGFVNSGETLYRTNFQTLDHTIPEPNLAPGFTFQTMTDDTNLLDRIEIHREVWSPSKFTLEAYQQVRAAPMYRQDLDLAVLAPDDRYACYLIAWWDPVAKSGLEPVGARSDYRRLGLTKALIFEALRRLQDLGANRVYVLSHREGRTGQRPLPLGRLHLHRRVATMASPGSAAHRSKSRMNELTHRAYRGSHPVRRCGHRLPPAGINSHPLFTTDFGIGDFVWSGFRDLQPSYAETAQLWELDGQIVALGWLFTPNEYAVTLDPDYYGSLVEREIFAQALAWARLRLPQLDPDNTEPIGTTILTTDTTAANHLTELGLRERPVCSATTGIPAILELGGDHIAVEGDPLQRRGVVVGRHQVHIGHGSRRRGRVGVDHERAIAHRAGGDEGVPAELTATHHPDRGRRDDRLVPHRPQRPVPFTRRRAAAAPSPPRRRGVGAGSRAARSARSRRSRPAWPPRTARRSSRRPRRWRTWRPGCPPASARSNGASPGPPRCRDATGTPSTGTIVLAASIPGRWAAPPAPAMIARRPRPAACSAYSNISSGIRWALTTRASCATPNSVSTSTAFDIVGQSLADPITTPTTTTPATVDSALLTPALYTLAPKFSENGAPSAPFAQNFGVR